MSEGERERDRVRECVFFFKQKTAYEIGTGDWSSDVYSSDLAKERVARAIPKRVFGTFGPLHGQLHALGHLFVREIGRASCRERV